MDEDIKRLRDECWPKWFAWRPVFLGPLGAGPLVWLKTVRRNRNPHFGVTIYQPLDMFE